MGDPWEAPGARYAERPESVVAICTERKASYGKAVSRARPSAPVTACRTGRINSGAAAVDQVDRRLDPAGFNDSPGDGLALGIQDQKLGVGQRPKDHVDGLRLGRERVPGVGHGHLVTRGVGPDEPHEPEPAIFQLWEPAFGNRHQITALNIGGAVADWPFRSGALRIVMEADLRPDVGASDGATLVVTNADGDRVGWPAGFLDRGGQSVKGQGQAHGQDGHEAGRVSQSIPKQGFQDTLSQSDCG